MREQIFLGGAPVVGFGVGLSDEASEKKFYGVMIGVPLLGIVAGSIGGAVLGKGVIGTAAGAVIGGLVGGAAGIGTGILVLKHEASTAVRASWTWQRIPELSDLSKLKAGDQLAFAIAEPGDAPISPELLADIKLQFTALNTAPVNLPTKNFVLYPPGSKLPADWPRDDSLGPNAYRITADVITDAPPSAAWLKPIAPSEGTVEVWARAKP
jgi:hypothetical protein